MTEEEKNQAAAYIKLQDDVKQLIVDTIHKELQTYGSTLQTQIQINTINTHAFKEQVKSIVRDQMTKY